MPPVDRSCLKPLDCYWVGSLDCSFLGNQGVFHETSKTAKLFAVGSTATKALPPSPFVSWAGDLAGGPPEERLRATRPSPIRAEGRETGAPFGPPAPSNYQTTGGVRPIISVQYLNFQGFFEDSGWCFADYLH